MANNYFSTLLPPPNLTGVLHLGHIWNATLQDFCVRWNKIIPKNTRYQNKVYWGYGFDHAGLSLQIKFESDLREKGIDFSSWTNEKYYQEINKWKDEKAACIRTQYSAMNFLLDPDDLVYTMDDFSIDYTLESFKKLFDKGFIYQKEKLVNWDTSLKTAISDVEIEYKSEQKKLYFVNYQVVGSDKHLVVATTRPETMFGDVALFVHPEDERYQEYIGKKVLIPYINRKIPVISDIYVDKGFGTGVLKCTPAHDFADWDLGTKYKLDIIKSFDEHGIMTKEAKIFEGQHKDEVKKKIALDWPSENYQTNIAYSGRSKALIEPTVSKQWFLDATVLAHNCLRETGQMDGLDIFPFNQFKNMLSYMGNMTEWCISRQIKWGIQLPIYIEKKTGKAYCSVVPLDSSKFTQVEDRLDTWFTSSLWPKIVFNSERKEGLNQYYPIDLLVSGKDILLFWVCKMLFMGWHLTGKLPFKQIYLHGLILTADGQKMSKSLNNGVTPEDLLNKYDSDAMRLFFVGNTIKDNNIKYLEDRLEDCSRQIHKIKNALFFFKKNKLIGKNTDFAAGDLTWYEKDCLFELYGCFEELQEQVQTYQFSNFALSIRGFFVNFLCAHYIEMLKLDLNRGISENSKNFACFVWAQLAQLFWPLLPKMAEFIAEDILNVKIDQLKFELSELNIPYLERYAVWHKAKMDKTHHRWFYEFVEKTRRLKYLLDIPFNQVVDVLFVVKEKELEKFTKSNEVYLPYLEFVHQKATKIVKDDERSKGFNFLLINNSEWSFCCEWLIEGKDMSVFEKLVKDEQLKLKGELIRSKKVLSNLALKDKAPEIYAEEIEKKEVYEKELAFLEGLEKNYST